MQQFFGMLWGALGRVFTALLPKVIGEAAGKVASTVAIIFRWIVLLVLFLCIVYGLYYINVKTGLGTFLPDFFPRYPEVKNWYLPLLGFIVILVGVVLYFFFASWDAEPDESPFPDIDEAWQKAMGAISQAGILPHQVSLFLVLGRPESAETNLFDGAGVNWVVKHSPPDPTAPVYVYVEKESSPKSAYPGAIYVTCRG